MKKVNIDKWADDFRLIEERDNVTIKQIDYILDWLPSNEFWSTNIRSPKKLRDQFERLVVEIRKGKSNNRYGKQITRKETLPKWAEEDVARKETPVSAEEQKAFEEQLRKLGVQKE